MYREHHPQQGLSDALMEATATATAAASASVRAARHELAGYSEALSAFPETMLRALLHGHHGGRGHTPTTPAARQLEPQQQGATVPVLLFVPSAALNPGRGALARLLEVDHTWTTPAAAPAARSAPEDDDGLPVTWASFGERTAAAKRMLSAAPGGPVPPRPDSAPRPAPRPAQRPARDHSGDGLSSRLPSFGQRTAAARERMIRSAPGGTWRESAESISPPQWSSAAGYLSTSSSSSNSQEEGSPSMVKPLYEAFADQQQRKKQSVNKGAVCVFCKKNGESWASYSSHRLSKRVGTSSIVTCPVLRSLHCDICGATGDFAHTKTYCPSNTSEKLRLAIILKKTMRRSDGSFRK